MVPNRYSLVKSITPASAAKTPAILPKLNKLD
jgi:hypothetical protein